MNDGDDALKSLSLSHSFTTLACIDYTIYIQIYDSVMFNHVAERGKYIQKLFVIFLFYSAASNHSLIHKRWLIALWWFLMRFSVSSQFYDMWKKKFKLFFSSKSDTKILHITMYLWQRIHVKHSKNSFMHAD